MQSLRRHEPSTDALPHWCQVLPPLFALACSQPAPAGAPPASLPAGGPAPPASASSAPTPAAPPNAAAEPESGAALSPVRDVGTGGDAALAELDLLSFRKELDVSVRSIALGKRRKAILADEPWLSDKGKWHKIPLPAQYQPPPDSERALEIYFGRDDRPRLIGYYRERPSDGRARDAGTMPVYLRYKAAGWHAEWSEIGRLGARRPGALYGVLGHDDPELVCKQDEACIIKRHSGWATIQAPPGVAIVRLCGQHAWAAFPGALARVEANRLNWVSQQAPWRNASGLWGNPDGTAWVSEEDTNRIHRFDGQSWQQLRSPVAAPRHLWAPDVHNVWLVGEGGAAHYDGVRWRRVRGISGPLRRVEGTAAADVWLGGRSGLWHGTAIGAEKTAEQ